MTLVEATPHHPPANHHRVLQVLCTDVLVYSNPALYNARRCNNENPTGECCLWHKVSISVSPRVTAHIYALVKNAETLCNIRPTTAGMFYLTSSKEWHVKMVVQGLQYRKPYENTELAHRIFNNLKSSDLALLLAVLLHFPVMLENPQPSTQSAEVAMQPDEGSHHYTSAHS